MKFTHLTNSLAIALLLAFGGSGARAQGIPVYDNLSVVNTITNQIANMQQYISQYNTLVRQYNQQIEQYKSLTGIRNYHNLLNNPLARQYLPEQWAGLYQQAMTASGCLQYQDAGALASCAARAKLQSDRAITLNMQTQIAQRKRDIQNLIGQLGGANDAKDTADLTARLAGEQANLAAEQAELSAYERASQMQAQSNEAATIQKLLTRSINPQSNPFNSMPASVSAAPGQ